MFLTQTEAWIKPVIGTLSPKAQVKQISERRTIVTT